jgi:hypothetical protein
VLIVDTIAYSGIVLIRLGDHCLIMLGGHCLIMIMLRNCFFSFV